MSNLRQSQNAREPAQKKNFRDDGNMAAFSLTSEEEQATKQFLEEINYTRRDDNGGSPVPWATGVRFLMARKFEVHRAVDLFGAHEEVRKREGISDVDPFDESVRRELLTEKFTVLSGRDATGAAIALFTARLHLPIRTTHQAVLKGLVFQLDAALQSVDTQRNGLVFIYDMTSSKYHNFDYELSIKILSLLKGSYPARLKKVLIVTAPLWFKAPFKILRLFVREKLRDRVFTVSVNQLPLHIPMSSLTQHLGGTVDHCHKDWLRTCLQVNSDGQTTYIDNDIAAFFDMPDNAFPSPTDVSYPSVASGATTPSSWSEQSLATNASSDMDVDNSPKEALTEKQNQEDREKEVSVEKDPRRQQSNSGPSPPCKRNVDGTVASGGETGPALPRKKRPASEYSDSGEESIHHAESGGMTVLELVEHVKTLGRRGLFHEYALIKSESPAGSFDISKAKYNLPKNRYTDVLCLDQTRVHLEPAECDPSSDYINANFVDGYKQKNAYISTQGPLPRTFPDFWRMVWEQQVLIIVMTTRTVERSRLKCGQYWPLEEATGENYGLFVVINNGVDKRNDYNITSLTIQNTKTNETREVTHFQFTGWPDYGVPPSAVSFLDIMFHVRQHQAERTALLGDNWTGHPLGPPIAIHCSAGIGRTGTFITMDICTKRLADIGTVDIRQTVRRIRTHRAFSIQMPDQYVFCHLALIEHAQREMMLDESDVTGFEESSDDSE